MYSFYLFFGSCHVLLSLYLGCFFSTPFPDYYWLESCSKIGLEIGGLVSHVLWQKKNVLMLEFFLPPEELCKRIECPSLNLISLSSLKA
jgi:hypothetical protein